VQGEGACRAEAQVLALHHRVLEVEQSLVPIGLHVAGQAADVQQRREMLEAMARAVTEAPLHERALTLLAEGGSAEQALALDGQAASAASRSEEDDTARAVLFETLARANRYLAQDREVAGLLRALAGRYVAPAPGGDLLRNPAVLPTGRNLHGFDPHGIPSAFAMREGARQAEILLRRHVEDGHALPRAVAMVLWGADNLKSGGAPIGQALALLGARPRLDSYGKLCGAELIDLAELGRPRIDVVMTLSGVFRDLLPLQVRLLAEAAQLAAAAPEPLEQNFVRAHALAYMAERGCDLATAALRVFGNAENAYGANVNHLIDNGGWERED